MTAPNAKKTVLNHVRGLFYNLPVSVISVSDYLLDTTSVEVADLLISESLRRDRET